MRTPKTDMTTPTITTDLVIGTESTRVYLPVVPNVGEKICIYPRDYVVNHREFSFAVHRDGSVIYEALVVTLYLSTL